MKRILTGFTAAIMMTVLLGGCGIASSTTSSATTGAAQPAVETTAATEAAADVAMQYMTGDELNGILGTDGYTVLDVRKAEDYAVSHIPGSLNYDCDGAVTGGDQQAAVDAMTAAAEGIDDTLILVCYSGKRYAQAATNALATIGYDMSKVYTLEGGFNNWVEVYPELTYAVSGDPVEAEPEEAEAAAVSSYPETTVYVSAEWVDDVISGGQPESADYVILECAWGEVEYDPDYEAAHVPGAVHMNTDLVEEEVYWNIRSGEEIEQLCVDYGITKDTTVICYSGDVKNSADDRVAFAMLWAGVENVKCLDGGMEAWTKAGYDTESGVVEPTATTAAFGVAVPAHPEYIVSMEDAAARLKEEDNFKLVSIRSWAEYTGETSGYSYIDRAGEPEGAVWGHDTDDGSYETDCLTADISVLEGYLSDVGASLDDDLAFYCGTGWRATIPFLICYQNGVSTQLYDGGWFQWQMNEELPVQVGDPASADCVITTVGELSTDKAA